MEMESQSLVAGVKALKHAQPEDVQELLNKLLQDLQSKNEELADFINTPNWNRPVFCNNDDDDDEEYTIAITPVLPTEKPDNSLSHAPDFEASRVPGFVASITRATNPQHPLWVNPIS
ncbi:hypothetical protein Tco_0623019 [Tanacetum coccineum]